MNQFKWLNNLGGWTVFLASLLVYVLTMEETASFWDCGEFIAVSYKLMVPHPPGAPLFLLIGRVLSMLAGDVTTVAWWINLLSALTSALSSMFLCWTISLLALKLVEKSGTKELSLSQQLSVVLSGVIGGMAYTFCDSAWFSAVEAEVYALSSFFTAVVIWAMFKWERVADEPGADRWLIFIAYMMGLSIGVHLLNLVTVPALGYIYYFRRYKPSTLGMIFTLLISLVILVLVQNGVIIYLPSMAGKFEVFFVNSLGLPFNSGSIVFILLFVAALVWGVRYSIQKKNVLLNTGLLAFVFVVIGYLSYGVILIRSNNATPINENQPDDVISFVSYLKREQYGDRPLLNGPLFNSQPSAQVQGDPIYTKGAEKYEIVDYKIENEYDSREKTLLPRLYSQQPNHIAAYKRWVNIREDRKPSVGQNISFMLKYQIGWMYWRYFMWNFAGRASDFQDAEWIAPWDSTKGLPEVLATNKARNNFYMLPLILGLVGLYFHIVRSGRDSFVVGMLFLMTGIAIVVYLNQPPIEPRERDYTFAGSWYAFCIWIGLGVLALSEWLKKYLGQGIVAPVAATLVASLVPGIMAAQGWDDHDRSGRFHSVDQARNLLESCAPNAILFTGGDNDTFPLWYAQEVEGIRTDVRVCNLSLLGTDWYIDQMKTKVYESEPLPITLEFKNYVQGKNDYLVTQENPVVKNGMRLREYIALVKREHPGVSVPAGVGSAKITILPTKTFFVDVDTQAVKASGILPKGEESKLVPVVGFTLPKSTLYKSDLLMLDMIANNNWKRPIYFSTTLARSNFLNLKEFMYLEGMAYRLLPLYNRGASEGAVNTDIMYINMMKKFQFRGLNEPRYYDENYRRFPLNNRSSFYRLAEALANQGKTEQAKEVIEACFAKMPDSAIPYDPYCPQFIPLMRKLGMDAAAKDIQEKMGRRVKEELAYYTRTQELKRQNMDNLNNALYTVYQLFNSSQQAGDQKAADEYNALLNQYQNEVNQEVVGEDY